MKELQRKLSETKGLNGVRSRSSGAAVRDVAEIMQRFVETWHQLAPTSIYVLLVLRLDFSLVFIGIR